MGTSYTNRVGGASAIDTPFQRQYNIRAYGAVGDAANSIDDASAIQAAIDAASAAGGGSVYIPGGYTYLFESDIQMKSDVLLVGDGHSSHLRGGGSALKVDGITQGAHVTDWAMRDFQLSRIGDSGPALHTTGDGTTGSNKGAIRFLLSNVKISGSTGHGWLAENTYIGDAIGCYFRGCSGSGFKARRDPLTETTAVNAVCFFGGEFQNNSTPIRAEHVTSVFFDGVKIEGNTNPVYLGENCRNVTFDTAYWELNGSAAGSRDMIVGDTGGTAVINLHVKNSQFFDGSGAIKDAAVSLVKVTNSHFDTCFFNNYEVEGIENVGGGSNVSGVVRCGFLSSTPSLCTGFNSNFRQAPEEVILTGSGTWDIPSLGAINDTGVSSSASTTITVTGASTTDFVDVAQAGGFSDIFLRGKVTSSNTVTLTAFNTNKTTARDPGNTTYRVRVIPSSYDF